MNPEETLITGDEILFNPFDPNFRINPYPIYERLRTEDPIHKTPFEAWVLSKYSNCTALLHDPRTSSDERNATQFRNFIEANGNPYGDDWERRRPFLFMDPPDHTRLRGLVSKAFTPRVVENLRPIIRELVNGLLNRAAGKGRMEVIEDFAYALPVTVISDMLGVPSEDHEIFKDWSRELARSLDPELVLPPEVVEKRQKAVTSFRDYFSNLIAERRSAPKHDLLSGLIEAEESGDSLTTEELITTCVLLLIAGHETTVNLIGNGILNLLRNPSELAKLRENREVAKTAVEEVLRFDPPVQMTGRVALEDIEIGTETIRKGQQAIVLLASANRDPDQFPDADSFDVTRKPNAHLAFSMGIHFCLGAYLARVEGQIALGEFAARVRDPALEKDVPEYKENVVLRGLASLPVNFREILT